MLTTLILLCLLPTSQDETKLESLIQGSVVRFGLPNQKSVIGEFLGASDNAVSCLDLESLETIEIPRNQIESVRDNVNQTLIFERAGVGRWLGWQLSKQFEGLAKPLTVASIQQASVFVTANPSSGIMEGDEVFVYRLGEPVKDPTTGEILDTPEQKISKMVVMEVSDKLITCRPTGEFSIPLMVGDTVRPAMSRSSVAVLPFSNATGRPTKSGLSISDQVIDSLAKLGVETLERERLASILKEQLFQIAKPEGDATRIGKLLGASTLVTGSIIEKQSNPKESIITIRLLDVRTGQVVKSFQADVSTKNLDGRIASNAEVLPVIAPASPDGSFLGIKPFGPGKKSLTFEVPPDAKKIEISFVGDGDIGNTDPTKGSRVPCYQGKIWLNGTAVISWVKKYNAIENGKKVPYNLFTVYDGSEVNTRHPDQIIGTIDVTSLVKLGEANSLSYSHNQSTPKGVKIWITK